MRLKDGKIFISQRNMNRMFYGSHLPWQVLRNEGIGILVNGEGARRVAACTRTRLDKDEVVTVDDDGRMTKLSFKKRPPVDIDASDVLSAGDQPRDEIYGITLAGETFNSNLKNPKFLISQAMGGQKGRVREVKIAGLPPIIADV
jgi:hypothetical protein